MQTTRFRFSWRYQVEKLAQCRWDIRYSCPFAFNHFFKKSYNLIFNVVCSIRKKIKWSPPCSNTRPQLPFYSLLNQRSCTLELKEVEERIVHNSDKRLEMMSKKLPCSLSQLSIANALKGQNIYCRQCCLGCFLLPKFSQAGYYAKTYKVTVQATTYKSGYQKKCR